VRSTGVQSELICRHEDHELIVKGHLVYSFFHRISRCTDRFGDYYGLRYSGEHFILIQRAELNISRGNLDGTLQQLLR